MDTDLVRAVARGLRYRSLPHLIGRAVELRNLGHVEEAVRAALGPDLPAGYHLAGPELRFREGAVAKYGILDLEFSAPPEALAGEMCSGVTLLRELGFLPGGGVGPSHRVCDDPTCLEMLHDDLEGGRVWLLLSLEGGRPGPVVQVPPRVPAGYLPQPFRVADACLTNARGVWLWKHFYL